ncbi:MAG: hypothetical protein R2769_06250 [Saprospiraceae bacterium]
MDNPKLNKAKELMVMGLLGSMTLGLAPFFPEPHIIGKVKWILGGAVGMKPIDWFDTLMHGAPFLLLIYAIVNYFLIKGKS